MMMTVEAKIEIALILLCVGDFLEQKASARRNRVKAWGVLECMLPAAEEMETVKNEF